MKKIFFSKLNLFILLSLCFYSCIKNQTVESEYLTNDCIISNHNLLMGIKSYILENNLNKEHDCAIIVYYDFMDSTTLITITHELNIESFTSVEYRLYTIVNSKIVVIVDNKNKFFSISDSLKNRITRYAFSYQYEKYLKKGEYPPIPLSNFTPNPLIMKFKDNKLVYKNKKFGDEY